MMDALRKEEIYTILLMYRKNGGIIIHKPKPVNPYEAAMAELSRLREKKLAESGKKNTIRVWSIFCVCILNAGSELMQWR